ncbi:MAG: glycosyltransferase [Chitinophagaceae bacterium]
MPKFSILIPNYNHEHFLEQRIESVLGQTFQNFEVIILDDMSTDNSRLLIEKYRHNPKILHLVYNEHNSSSPFIQWKKGIEYAKADWIWIAESDDLAHPSFLEEAAKNIQNHPEVGCYYTDSYIINEKENKEEKVSSIKNNFFETKKWSESYYANGKDELNECLKLLCTINNTSALVFRKEVFTAVQEQVISYRYYGDWFFFINALLQGDIYYNHNPLSSYRNHSSNFVSNNLSVADHKKEYYRLLQFLLSRPEITQKKEVIRFFCLHYLGSGWVKEGIVYGISLYNSYFKLDKELALKVIPKLVWYKLTGQKNKKLYP